MDPKIARQILDIEGGKENRAIKVFRQQLNQHKAMLEKQKEFEEYRTEYERQISEMGKNGRAIDSEELANYHQFKGALDTAIDQQSGLVSKTGNAVEDSRSEWSASHRRRQALQQLIDNQHRERRLDQEKQSQKLMDEFSMSSHSH